LLGFGEDDLEFPRLHTELPPPPVPGKFMRPPAHQDNYGKVAGLYTYYSTLNRMFKKKIGMRVGDKKKLW